MAVLENKIKIEDLRIVPQLNLENLNGRSIPNLAFYEDGEWILWIPTPSGLKKLKGEPVESTYFSKTPVLPTDVSFQFLNIIMKRAFWPSVTSYIHGIQNDILNLASSLAKLDLIFHIPVERDSDKARFVSTEIEYIFYVCRSLFDLLQKVISKLWMNVTLFDNSVQKKELPSSFRKVILSGGEIRAKSEIRSCYRLPETFVDFYLRRARFFKMLKDYRDKIVHEGEDYRFIFVTERGFAVPDNIEPFASFGIWNEEHKMQNGLSSLRAALAYVIIETFEACEDFADTLVRSIQLPPDIVPGYDLYLRGQHNHELTKLHNILENSLWWDEA